jgi:hypothetical protein
MAIKVTRGIAGTLLLFVSVACFATPPLMDRVQYENETTTLWEQVKPWPDLPRSEKLQELRRSERCSAIGGPRGIWHIVDSRLWLTGLFRCGGDVPLESVYGGTGEPIFAEWITATMLTHRGRRLCGSSYGRTVYEKTLTMKVEKGVVKEVTEVSNEDHPAVLKNVELGRVAPCSR